MADEMSKGMSEAGREAAHHDWSAQDAYWRSHYSSRPYVSADRSYRHYEPGYRYGAESAERYRGRRWEEIEPDLRSGWEARGERSTWDEMKGAVRDAWDRITGRGR